MRRALGEEEIRVASSDDREYKQPPAQSAGCSESSARVHPQRSTVGEAEANVAEPEMEERKLPPCVGPDERTALAERLRLVRACRDERPGRREREGRES
jgi:hypothetical protein